MNQMASYIMIMSGLMLLFYFTGFATNNLMLDLVLNPQSINDGGAGTLAAAIVALSGVGAIVAGLYFGNKELAAMSVLLPLFTAIMWTFTEVVAKIMSYSYILGVLVMGPFMFLFLMTIIEWWRGRD